MYTAKRKGILAFLVMVLMTALAACAVYLSAPARTANADTKTASSAIELMTAMVGAAEGDTVQLTDDVTLDLTTENAITGNGPNGHMVLGPKSLLGDANGINDQILDLNGYTLTVTTGSTKCCIEVMSGVSITVKGGTLIGSSAGVFAKGAADSSIVLEDVALNYTYTGTEESGFALDSAGEVKLTAVTFTLTGATAYAENTAGAAVATIGETYYSSLQSALDAIKKTGTNVNLISDTNEDIDYTVAYSNGTLYLNGHTLSGNLSFNTATNKPFYIDKGATNVGTVKGTLSVSGATTKYLQFYMYANAEITTLTASKYAMVYVYNGAYDDIVVSDEKTQLTICGGTVNQSVTVNESATCTIKSGVFDSETPVVNNGGTVSLSGDALYPYAKFKTASVGQYLTQGYLLTEEPDDEGYYAVELNPIFELNGTYYNSLRTALTAAASGDTIVMQKDYRLDAMSQAFTDKNVTIDLNGNKLIETYSGKNSFQIGNSNKTAVEVTFTDRSKEQTGAIVFDGDANAAATAFSVTYKSTLILENVTVDYTKAAEGCGISVGEYNSGTQISRYGNVILKNATVKAGKTGVALWGCKVADTPSTLTATNSVIEGGMYAVAGNGSFPNTVISLTNCTVTATDQTDSTGIYHPQIGELTVNGGSVTGMTGIEIRSGSLIVGGGAAIRGTGDPLTADPNGSGTTVIGAAIAISQHTTNNAISVSLGEGTYTGAYAVFEKDLQDSETDGIAIDITGGVFEGAVSSENVTGFISGGTFTEEVDRKYFAEGFAPLWDEESDSYVVAVTVAELNGVGYATLQEAINAAENDTVKLLADVKEDILVAAGKTLTLDLNGYKIQNLSEHTVTNKGNLTVIDSVGGGTVDSVLHGKGAIYNAVGGTVNLYGGNFTRSEEAGKYGTGSNGNSWYVLFNQGTMVIGENQESEVKVYTGSSPEDSLNYNFSSLIENGWSNPANKPSSAPSASLTINGGLLATGLACVKNDECATLTVTGGRFDCPEDQAIQAWSDVTITGGEFNGAILAWTYAGIVSDYSVKIEGGTFLYEIVTRVDGGGEAELPEIAISGGAFKIVPDYTYFTDGHVAAKAEDGEYFEVTAGSYVAYIENANGVKVGYSDLQEAINSAEEDAEIVLIAAVKKNITVGSDKKIVLDLNGYTMEGGSSSTVLVNYGNLTIKDGVGEGAIAPANAWFAIENQGTLVLKEITVTARMPVSNTSADGVVTVDGATLNGTMGAITATSGKVDIVSGTVNGSLNAGENAVISIRGGRFSVLSAAQYLDQDTLFYEDESGYRAASAANAVAKIGSVGYETLDAAIAACADGEKTEIVLLADAENILIPAGKVITLDVNGHTVTATAKSTAAIRNWGTLYLVDNAENKGTITRNSDTNWYVIVNNGVMEISDVTVKNENAADPSSLVINNYSPYENKAKLTILSGSFYSYGSNAVKNDELGTLVIRDGYFSSNPTQHAAVMTWGTADIYGGTFVSNTDSGISVMAYGGQTNVTTIYGGTFNAPTALFIQSGDSGNDPGVLKISIQGGEFNGDILSCTAEGFTPSSDDTITISAGKFAGELSFGDMTAGILGGTYAREASSIASDMLESEYVAYYTDDETEITVGAKTAVPADAILVAGRSAQSFQGYRIDDAYIALPKGNEYIIIGAEEYAEYVLQDLAAFKADLLNGNLYSENGKAQIESYYVSACADIEGFAKADDIKNVGLAAQAAKTAMNGVPTKYVDEAAVSEAVDRAKAELKQYAAALGILWNDEYYGDVESAATLAAVAEAKLAAMESLDRKIIALNEAKSAAIQEVEGYAAAQQDEEGNATAVAVTVPTATYAAINGAASEDEIRAYVENAKAEIDALRAAAAQTASLNEKLTELQNAVAALKAVADSNGTKLTSLAAAVDEAKSAIATANGKLDDAAEALGAIEDAQTKMSAALNEFIAATNATLASMDAKLVELDGDLSTLTGTLATVNSELAEQIKTVKTNVNAISVALVQLAGNVDENYTELTANLAALQATIDAIGESVNASTTVEEAKTEAKAQLDTWLSSYIKSLTGNSASVGTAKTVSYTVAAKTLATADYNKLAEAFGESGAKLIEKYYNDALTAIDGATTATEVAVAVSNFKTQVAMVEMFDGLDAKTDLTGVYVMLAVIAVVAIAAVVLVLVLLTKKGRLESQPAAVAQTQTPAEEVAPAPVAQVLSSEETDEADAEESEESEENEELTSENVEEPAEEQLDEEQPVGEPLPEEEPSLEAEDERETVDGADGQRQEETVAAEAESDDFNEEVDPDQSDEEIITVSQVVAGDTTENDPSIPDWRSMGTKYYKPFTERMAEASEENRAWYSEIKNELCSYKKVKDRTSRKCESYRAGRKLLAKVMIIGKTLRLYLALDPAAYEFSMYHHRDMGDKKSFAEVPMMVKVKSPRGVKKAKRLIGELMQSLQIEKNPGYAEKDFSASFTSEE